MSEQREQTTKQATFNVQIQFQQNATWQGTIRWLEGEKTQQFRSELELLKLMMDALNMAEQNKLLTW